MKIDGNIPSQAVDSYRKVDTPKQAELEKAGEVEKGHDVSARVREEVSDKVSISGEAKLRALALSALDKLPDVRQDKVDKLSRLIESDQYNPDAEKIAEKMLSGFSIKI